MHVVHFLHKIVREMHVRYMRRLITYSSALTMFCFTSLDWFVSFHLVYVPVSSLWYLNSIFQLPPSCRPRKHTLISWSTTQFIRERHSIILPDIWHNIRHWDMPVIYVKYNSFAILFPETFSRSIWSSHLCEWRFYNVVWTDV